MARFSYSRLIPFYRSGRDADLMNMKHRILWIFISFLLFQTGFAETGYASWYGGKFHGRPTASGEIFDTNKMTAAHKTLPFGTMVRVTNRTNRKTAVVRINDRGPFVEGRIIDLSRAAAKKLGILETGVAPVQIEIVPESAVPEEGTKTIQVSSFRNREYAERMKSRLAEAGVDCELEHTQTGLTRVVIRSIAVQDVDSVIRKLDGLGYHTVLIRSE